MKIKEKKMLKICFLNFKFNSLYSILLAPCEGVFIKVIYLPIFKGTTNFNKNYRQYHGSGLIILWCDIF